LASNSREVWIIAIVLAGVSFLGYAAVKYFGAQRGLLLAAAAGAVASAIMFLRVTAIVAALKSPHADRAHPSGCHNGGSRLRHQLGVLAKGRHPSPSEGGFSQSVRFLSVVGFALFLGLIIVLGRTMGETFGATGAVAGAIWVGIADIDAITVSMARLTPETLSASDAALAILAAVAKRPRGAQRNPLADHRGDLGGAHEAEPQSNGLGAHN
jgi:uncharacterized membrane protein (DUF4010 family)